MSVSPNPPANPITSSPLIDVRRSLQEADSPTNDSIPLGLDEIGKQLRELPYLVVGPAVYFLVFGNEIVYVGQTINLGLEIQ